MKLHKRIWTVAAALLLSGMVVRAQNQLDDPQTVIPTTPLPPASSSPASSGGNNVNAKPLPAARGVSPGYDSQPVDTVQAEPDTHTLSGAELFSVASAGAVRNIFDPSVSVTATVDTGLGNSSGQQNIRPSEIFEGQLNFNRSWDRYHLTALYDGGGIIYQNYQGDSSFHEAALKAEIDGARWRLNLRDNFSASFSAAFGGLGRGGPGLVGANSSTTESAVNTIDGSFVPNETIQTGQAMRYNNTALAEADYSFSRRSAVTFAGSYGLLHFSDVGYISSHAVSARTGYDYMLDPKDTIALLGSYGRIDYTGTDISTENYAAALAFGRRITGRLAFQASAGPQRIRDASGANGNFTIWTFSANSALTYQSRRTTYNATYERGLADGSGVLFGATANTFSASVSRHVTRLWFGSASAAYAMNRGISASSQPASSFNTWFIGANIGHPITHHAQINFNYGVVKQGDVAVCPVTNCGGTAFRQTFGVTVNWHLRPVE